MSRKPANRTSPRAREDRARDLERTGVDCDEPYFRNETRREPARPLPEGSRPTREG